MLWKPHRYRGPAQLATEAPQPALPLDMHGAEFIQNPYPALSWLRQHQPVHRCASGAWVLTRYADVYQALSDVRLGNRPADYSVVSKGRSEERLYGHVASNILPYQDGPNHAHNRRAIARVFHQYLAAKKVNFHQLAVAHLNTFLPSREMDVLEDFATPFSISAMQSVFALEHIDAERLKGNSLAFFHLFSQIRSEEVLATLDEALIDFRAIFLDEISRCRHAPGSDLIGMLVSDDEVGAFSDELLADNCMLLFADGIENVDAGIASVVKVFTEMQGRWRKISRHLTMLPEAIEEALRLESPAQFIARVAQQPLTIQGINMAAGEAVMLMLASANRDQSVFSDPDEFSVKRSGPRQIGFGHGRHSCIGARLAKAEILAALTVLLERCPRLTQTRAPIVWDYRPGHRWLRHLVVTF